MNDHWQVQGRQGHGWFGHGTRPGKPENPGHDPSTAFRSVDDRVVALVHGAIASLPASLRVRAEAHHQRGTLPRLKEALTAWIRGARLDRTGFADYFLGRAADDPIADTLRSAASAAATATSHADMTGAAGRLADAIKAVGIDRWPGFVADASERARDPATQAAIQASSQPPPHAPDAIRPVYPVETAIGVLATGVVGGVGAAARTLGGAIVRGVTPSIRPAAEGAPAEEPASGAEPTDSPARPLEQGRPSEPATSVAPDNPKPDEKILTDDRRDYILNGDGKRGGGHGPGRGTPDKSEFPSDWSDDKVVQAIKGVANDPASVPSPAGKGRTEIQGTRDGINITVIVDGDGKTIVTAYPTNVPRNGS